MPTPTLGAHVRFVSEMLTVPDWSEFYGIRLLKIIRTCYLDTIGGRIAELREMTFFHAQFTSKFFWIII